MNEKLSTLVVKIIKVDPSAITYARYGTTSNRMHFTLDQTLHNQLRVGEHYVVIATHDDIRWRWIECTHVQMGQTIKTKRD